MKQVGKQAGRDRSCGWACSAYSVTEASNINIWLLKSGLDLSLQPSVTVGMRLLMQWQPLVGITRAVFVLHGRVIISVDLHEVYSKC